MNENILDDIESVEDIRENFKKEFTLEAEDKKDDKKSDDKKGSVADSIAVVIDTDWSTDNQKQMKNVQILKFLATSEDPLSNKFMKAIDNFTSGLKKEDYK